MSLNVVGLISGGKDSLYSLAHCVRGGHKIIALANLHPGATKSSQAQSEHGEHPDLDSFMYQTVGHSIVPLYASALGVPLYRKEITGTALQNGRYYETSSETSLGDETEDMYALVKEILERHPEINALSAGAILSTYQRTRVESVAVRLGLVPLAYLWQYPALPAPPSRNDSLTGLLDDMASSRCDARIIKIASGGVPSGVSFSNVADASTKAKLVSGMAPFFADSGQEFWLRGAVLGEGGEYETLALDGPGILWKKRIQVDIYETYEADAGTVYVQLGKASLAQRGSEQEVDLPIPVLLDKRFTAVQSEVVAAISTTTLAASTAAPFDSAYINQIDVGPDFVKSSSTVQISNLTSSGATAAEQLNNIITTLPSVLGNVSRTYKLPESCLASGNIISTMLLLRSMEDFASVNHVYSNKLWVEGVPNPPARVTIAALLPPEIKVSISLVYGTSTDSLKLRKGLHVQSRSYWAPANIGPYSQAVSVPVLRHAPAGSGSGGSIEVVHLAGQIPLVPSTMSMLDASFLEQAALALQNLWRVAQERCVDCWVGAGIAYLAPGGSGKDSDVDMLQRASQAAQVWNESHWIDEKGHSIRKEYSSTTEEVGSEMNEDSDEDFDIWDHQQRHRGFGSVTRSMTVGEHLHRLPNKNISIDTRTGFGTVMNSPSVKPPFIAAEVVGLPRNAPVEWWSEGLAGLVSMADAQSARVLSIPMISQGFWSLSGMAFEDNGDNKVDTAEDEIIEPESPNTSTSKQRALCVFVTLTIELNITTDGSHHLPRTLHDLIPHFMRGSEDTSSLRYELVTAKSFLNLSCPAAASVSEKVELLRQSCIVPCSHVWSTQTAMAELSSKSTSFGSGTTAQEKELATGIANIQLARKKSDEIGEVAAAIVMRIDAFST